ncbi:MAG: replicative DNA helicase [Hydrogenophilales bacterium]|nr:replicative DNA helicase [Hydrogenophilales bacterium]
MNTRKRDHTSQANADSDHSKNPGHQIEAEFQHTEHLLQEAMARLKQLPRPENRKIIGIPTGFSELDLMTSGLQPGELMIIAGRPSMGKTSLARCMAMNVLLDTGLPVVMFSIEMSSVQIMLHMLGTLAPVDQHIMRTGRLDPEDWAKLSAAAERLRGAPLYIDDGARTVFDISRIASHLAMNRTDQRLGLLVIDYLQLMVGVGDNKRAKQLSNITRSLKALAKTLNVPIIVTCQLHRRLERRMNLRPVMADLREVGALERDADLVLFIYRDEVYVNDSADKGVAEILIGKNRHGPVGTTKLAFKGEFMRFESLNHLQQYRCIRDSPA